MFSHRGHIGTPHVHGDRLNAVSLFPLRSVPDCPGLRRGGYPGASFPARNVTLVILLQSRPSATLVHGSLLYVGSHKVNREAGNSHARSGLKNRKVESAREPPSCHVLRPGGCFKGFTEGAGLKSFGKWVGIVAKALEGIGRLRARTESSEPEARKCFFVGRLALADPYLLAEIRGECASH
jgi:hypothetical protein